MKTQNHTDAVTIDLDRITLSFWDVEPIVIPRRTLRTRLHLIEWVYRLAGWPGMNLQRIRQFIAAVFRHHGWALPSSNDTPLLSQEDCSLAKQANLPTDLITTRLQWRVA